MQSFPPLPRINAMLRISLLTGLLLAIPGLFLFPASQVSAQWNRYQRPQQYYPPSRYRAPQRYGNYGSGFQQPRGAYGRPASPYQQPAPGVQFGNRPRAQSPQQQPAVPGGAVTPEMAQRLYNRPKTDPPPEREEGQLYPRIGGEFEPQNAIVLSLSELLPQHASVFKSICQATAAHVRLVVLYDETEQVRLAMKSLADAGSLDHIYFKKLDMDTVWLRDFGPRMCQKTEDGGATSLDFFYDGQRPKDDSFPIRWAELTETGKLSAHWTLHGGNLMCNGQRLGLTTMRVFEDNRISFQNHTSGRDPVSEARLLVHREIKQYCNLDTLMVLKPLENEKTKHVDMFASFLKPDTVLVARIDPRRDPVNARILEENAQRLAQLKVDGKPMTVERIDVPPRNGTSWSPYTNNIIANKLVLMPVFDTDDPRLVSAAVETYKRILPDYTIQTVDTSTMKNLQGSLHCMTVNIPEYAPLPSSMTSFQQAREWYEGLQPTRQRQAGSPGQRGANPAQPSG